MHHFSISLFSQVTHVVARGALKVRAAPYARQGWPPSYELPRHRQVGFSKSGNHHQMSTAYYSEKKTPDNPT